jgi:hypothetical protein
MTAPVIQNFSVPAGNDTVVPLKAPADAPLAGDIYWRVYEEAFGIPDFDTSPAALIEKSTIDGGVAVGSPATSFSVQIERGDTVELLRNYYHEATLVDASGNISTLSCGIMTVTDTRNRL